MWIKETRLVNTGMPVVETGRGGDCLVTDTRIPEKGEISYSWAGFLDLNMEKWVDKQGTIMGIGMWRS